MPAGNMGKRSMGTALITGASEGIGYELSKIFATDGYNLVLVARNEKKLKKIKDDFERACGVSVKVIAKDLSEKSAPDEIYNELKDALIKPDVLVNNAGYNMYSSYAEADFSKVNDMIQVMVWAPARLTSLFLKDMLRRNRGRILNVSSIVAFAPSPFSAIYGACKAFLLLFTKSIAIELRGSNVSTTVLCPGNTRTQFASRAQMENTLIVKIWGMNAEDVARAGYDGLMKGKVYVVPGLVNKMLVMAAKYAPWSIQSRAAKILAE